jgi:hypothetical protein
MSKSIGRVRTMLAGLALLAVAGCATQGTEHRAVTNYSAGAAHGDGNYDHLIIAGVRIGPLYVDLPVSDVVKHLGSTKYVFSDPYQPALHRQYYDSECIQFFWTDRGLEPKIQDRLKVFCAKWNTPNGSSVGMTIQQIIQREGGGYVIYGTCTGATKTFGDSCVLQYPGVVFWAASRNVPIDHIELLSQGDNGYVDLHHY